jgi:hypoxanthine phosphoribosyltransferase
MPRLKGVIFSLRDVIVRRGAFDAKLFPELTTLIVWLRNQGIQPVFVGNHPWIARMQDGVTKDLKEALAECWGEVPWYIAQRGDMPFKPKADAMEHVLGKQGWKPHEAIYVGNTDDDMKTARNGKLLFLNALWHGEANPYGFQFDSPRDIARFVDCFCLGIDNWFWVLEAGDLRVYALAPFSTMSSKYADAQGYSYHARNTAKNLGGDPIFWGRLLAATVYLSGLAEEISYVTSYPGHSTTSAQPVVNDALSILADSLRKNFIPDLLVRHTTAHKSQTARQAGRAIDHLNQINSIHLNPAPRKNKRGEVYANPPLHRGKTVLVVDDFCTEGNSFEAARAYIQSTGAKTICIAWLKTINTDYREIKSLPKLRPYESNQLDKAPERVNHWFSNHIRNASATADLQQVFTRYHKWDWPKI